MAELVPETLVRYARATDQSFIATTFTEQLLRTKMKRSAADKLVDRILSSSRVRLAIACDAARTDRILGWLIYAPMPRVRAVIYTYVRAKHRRQGLLRQMARFAFENASGTYVYALEGPSTPMLLARHPAVQLSLDELL